MHIQMLENIEYAIHWVQSCLILHNMIIHFEKKLGKLSMIPWAQQEAHDLARDDNNIVMQIPISSLGQLFCADLMHQLFEVLGKPYVVNGREQ